MKEKVFKSNRSKGSKDYVNGEILNGKISYGTYTCWWKDGVIHREDGPAITYADGSVDWILNYDKVTEEDVLRYAYETKNMQAVKSILWRKY